MGTELAFYAVTSVIPLVMLTISLLGLILGDEAAQGQVSISLHTAIGDRLALTLENLLEEAARPGSRLGIYVFSMVVMVYMSSNMFTHIRRSLDSIWGYESSKHPFLLRIKGRIAALTVTLLVELLLLVLFAFAAMASAVTTLLERFIPAYITLPPLGEFLFISILALLVIAVVFRYSSSVNPGWAAVWPGAVITTLFFLVGKGLLDLYLKYSNITSLYGAAGSVLLLLLWVYFLAQIFFIGAEFIKVYSQASDQ